jgi:hypothetical protein
MMNWRVLCASMIYECREASNKHDNEYHDKATDSIINYEVSLINAISTPYFHFNYWWFRR